jgi:hypothetical protein
MLIHTIDGGHASGPRSEGRLRDGLVKAGLPA